MAVRARVFSQNAAVPARACRRACRDVEPENLASETSRRGPTSRGMRAPAGAREVAQAPQDVGAAVVICGKLGPPFHESWAVHCLRAPNHPGRHEWVTPDGGTFGWSEFPSSVRELAERVRLGPIDSPGEDAQVLADWLEENGHRGLADLVAMRKHAWRSAMVHTKLRAKVDVDVRAALPIFADEDVAAEMVGPRAAQLHALEEILGRELREPVRVWIDGKKFFDDAVRTGVSVRDAALLCVRHTAGIVGRPLVSFMRTAGLSELTAAREVLVIEAFDARTTFDATVSMSRLVENYVLLRIVGGYPSSVTR